MTVGRALLFVAAILIPGLCLAAETGIFDYNGRMFALVNQGEEMAVRTNIVLPAPGWTAAPGLGQAGSRAGRPVRAQNSQSWILAINAGQAQTAQIRQTATDQDGKVRIDIEITTAADMEVEGAYFVIDVARLDFAGGRLEVAAKPIALPVLRPPRRDSLGGQAASMALISANGARRLDVTLDRARRLWVEDKWERNVRTYSAVVELSRGRLAAGTPIKASLTLSLAAKPDTTAARLALDATQKRYKLRGFGGNYCFNIESPVTDYTLKNLRSGWARTEMSPVEWEPENDNASPTDTNWDVLKSHDTPGSHLHREFLVARQIQDLGIPYVISIWQLPEFLYSDPQPKPVRRNRRKIAADKWDELLECLGSYLVYAKQQYGVEPDLFSFNEANIGIDVLLTPEEHRDAIKRIGAHFEKLGLKTKLLLGDATGPRGTHEYVLAAGQDPEAMRYVTAVGFHSWGGGTPEQYQAWGDVAQWLGLPLLVTELGVDAAAYNGGMYDTYHYGLREVRMYQELALYARPQGTQQWEFTADYGTVRTTRNADGTQELVPTSRFYLVKHFTNLTPLNADALGTRSDNANVLFTAFAGEIGGRPVYSLHIANMASAREVTIEGLPASVASLRAVRTSETENYQDVGRVQASKGTVKFQIPARSLVTLTTMPPE